MIKIEVDPETYIVKADGDELIVSAEVGQRYFPFDYDNYQASKKIR